jgi:hypothetical protein
MSDYISRQVCDKMLENWFEFRISENPFANFVSPTISEILEKLPKVIIWDGFNGKKAFDLVIRWNNYASKYIVQYEDLSNRWVIHTECDNLPDALWKMWIWIKENNYLTNNYES